jgi:hypothetical protein
VINYDIGTEEFIPTMILDDLKTFGDKIGSRLTPLDFLKTLNNKIEPLINFFEPDEDPYGKMMIQFHEHNFKFSNQTVLSKRIAWMVLISHHCPTCK